MIGFILGTIGIGLAVIIKGVIELIQVEIDCLRTAGIKKFLLFKLFLFLFIAIPTLILMFVFSIMI